MSDYTIRLKPEHIASLILTRETLRRWDTMFGELDWASNLGKLADDIDELLFLAEREQKLPRLNNLSFDTMDAGRLLAMARERGLMPDEPYDISEPKHSMHHSLHADRADMDRKARKEGEA